MGGALAYIGDQLGIYWGKKRISFLGMRPKQTAVFINVFTGLLITLMTLMVASYLSENVQIALFETDKLIETQQRLKLHQVELLERTRSLMVTNNLVEDKNEMLQSEKAGLEKARVKLLDEKKRLELKVEEVDKSLLALKEDKEQKIEEIERLGKLVERKETALVAVYKGQSLLENPLLIPVKASTEEIEKFTIAMLDDLKHVAETQGVIIDTSSYDKVGSSLVSLISQKLIAIANSSDAGTINVTECSVQPVSMKNVSIGDHLQAVTFEVKPNLLVFGKDSEIARTAIDGRLSEEGILDQLFYFDTQVLSVLKERGVSPTSLRIRKRKISSVQLINFFKIVKLVRELGRIVLIRFVTLSPVYSYGDIDAIYKVEEMATPWVDKGRELGSTVISVNSIPPQTPSTEAVSSTSVTASITASTPFKTAVSKLSTNILDDVPNKDTILVGNREVVISSLPVVAVPESTLSTNGTLVLPQEPVIKMEVGGAEEIGEDGPGI
jgi:hypothetical protein